MAEVDSRWPNTKKVILEFQSLLRCGVCQKTLNEPLSLGHCEHYFCRLCAEAYFGKACPSCGVPSHAKNVQPNRQLSAATALCEQLVLLLGLTEESTENQDVEAESVLCDDDNIRENLPVDNKQMEEPSVDEVESVASKAKFLTVQKGKHSGNVKNLKIAQRRCWKKITESPGSIEIKEVTVKENIHSLDEGKTKDSIIVTRSSKRNNSAKTVILEEEDNSGKKIAEDGKANKKIDDCLSLPQDESASTSWNFVKENLSKRKKSCLTGDEMIVTDSGESHSVNGLNTPIREKFSARKRFKRSPTTNSTRVSSKQNAVYNIDSKTKENLADNKNTITTLFNSRHATQISYDDLPQTDLDSSMLSSLFSTPTTCSTLAATFETEGKLSRHETPPDPKTISENPKSISVVSQSSDMPKSFSVTRKSTSSKTKESPVTPRSCTGSARKQNKKGETRLHVACIKGDLELVHSLLEEGESPNVRDYANWTPLHEACNHGHAKISELLLNYGAIINVPGGENATPLHDAVQNNQLDCVRLLVSRGASKILRDSHGKTPVDYARNQELKEALSVPMTIIDSPVSVPLSAEALSMRPKSVTLMTTGLDPISRSSVLDCAKKLNWKVVDSFSDKVTHLVTKTNDNGICVRTIKYLQAVVTGKWIVKFDWVVACAERSSLVDEKSFEITGTAHNPKSYAPRKGRECIEQQQCMLFNGCHFYFQGDFCHPYASKEDLSNLVKLGSGIVLSREPKQETVDQSELVVPYHADPLSDLANCAYFTVTSHTDDPITMISTRMCRVIPSWIVSCITEFKLIDSSLLVT